jgi:ubiquinol-cytochrome c reductase cytochrome b subunit
MRAALSRWFFEDRLAPVTKTELEAAVAHQHHELEHIAHEEEEEIRGAHTRAGFPDAPVTPIDDGVHSETAVHPSNIIVAEPEPGTKPPKNREKDRDR